MLASVVAIASIGGGFFAGIVLVPLLYTAARTKPPGAERVMWTSLALVLVSEMTWGATYFLIGESGPAIWLLPLCATIGTLFVFGATHPRPRGQPG